MIPNFTKSEYRSSNGKALQFLIIPMLFLALGLYFSYSEIFSLTYFIGQVLLGIFFFQCFILLHETGHLSYFKNKSVNILFGHLFALLSFIPFGSWVAIHNLHHKWTGYRDKDPTTEGTVSPDFGLFTRGLVNICWFVCFPLFTLGYRFGNYWNISKIKRHVANKQLRNIRWNMLFQILLYFLLFCFFGLWMIKYIFIGYFISLVISDLFILSQHSHIIIPIAGEQDVKPVRYTEQIPYTRSIGFYKPFARYLYFNFNLHELHHAFPGMPAYHLDKIPIQTPNKVDFFPYLKDAKSMSGMQFIFSTSDKQIGDNTEKNRSK